MNNKKGQALSINTIIITILAIFVLVIIVVDDLYIRCC